MTRAAFRLGASHSWQFDEWWQHALSAWFVVWLTGLGMIVGSFLNVVISRVPLGLNVLYPASRCPRCLTAIRVRDNLPILSWLLLRGRCRACHLPIPARYVLVEAGTGAVFLLLALVELLSGGRNLPLRTPYVPAGVYGVLWETKWDLIGLYLYHALFCSWLIALALMLFDRRPLARGFVGIGWALGLLPPLMQVGLHPVPLWWPVPDALLLRPVAWGLVDGLCGLAVGALAGFVAGQWAPREPVLAFGTQPMAEPRSVEPPEPAAPVALLDAATDNAQPAVVQSAVMQSARSPWFTAGAVNLAAGAAVGVFLGWQAALTVVALGGLLRIAFVFAAVLGLGRSGLSLGPCICLAVLPFLVTWRWQFDFLAQWPQGPWLVPLLGWVVVCGALATLKQQFRTCGTA